MGKEPKPSRSGPKIKGRRCKKGEDPVLVFGGRRRQDMLKRTRHTGGKCTGYVPQQGLHARVVRSEVRGQSLVVIPQGSTLRRRIISCSPRRRRCFGGSSPSSAIPAGHCPGCQAASPNDRSRLDTVTGVRCRRGHASSSAACSHQDRRGAPDPELAGRYSPAATVTGRYPLSSAAVVSTCPAC
jgi:hypothetical protein